MLRMVLLLVVSALIVGIASSAKLPSSFKRCKANDPNLDDCLTKAVEGAIHDLKTGSKQVGIPPFEPLEIPELIIGEGTGPVNIRQHFKNVKLSGLTDSVILKYKADINATKFYVESISSMLQIDADYKMSGRILLLPVVGDGKCNITLTNAKLTHMLEGETYQRKGRTYMRVDKYEVTILPEKMTYYFENLFNGDERLGSEINRLINENWEIIFNDVKSGYEESFGLIFKDLTNRLFSRVQVKDIFIFE